MKRIALHKIWVALLALVVLLPLTAGCNSALVESANANRSSQNTAVDVAMQISPSVVAVITRGEENRQSPHEGRRSPHGRGRPGQEEQPRAEGSGIVFRQDGYIITNAHVIVDPNQTFVNFVDGSEVKAKVIGTDTFSDIGIIKINRNNLPVPKYGNSKDVKAGQTCFAIGNPFGLENTVTEGIISATRRSIPGGAPSLTNMLQTDAAISPGNSGGALVNTDARIIGITAAFIPPQTGAVSLGFAVPVDIARRVGNQLIQDGKATHSFLGVTPQTLTTETAKNLKVPVKEGAVISEIVDNGPAANAGLRKDDVIVRMDGIPVRGGDDVFGVVNAHSPGDKVNVRFYRGQDKKEVEVTLGERTTHDPSEGRNR